MNILVIGGGGREHAIIWKLSKSSKVNKLYCIPGNAGISELAELNTEVKWEDTDKLLEFIKGKNIDLTIIGPELPLVKGLTDILQQNNNKAFGPSCKASLLEGSKIWCKDFLKRHSIPTAKYKVFRDYIVAEKYIEDIYMKMALEVSGSTMNLVIKADGLAAGKGVFIVKSKAEAIQSLKQCMVDRIFGDAGKEVIIEECLEGCEVSLLAFTDGKTIVPMVTAQDFKRAYDKDKGPNTGGMGCISPSPVVNPELQDKIMKQVMYPTIEGLRKENIPYIGVLYAGLMIVNDEPYVLEFNCRFGDPETQVILPRLKTDLVEIFLACVERRLEKIKIEWEDNKAVCVVIASGGYPGNYIKGFSIQGLEKFPMAGEYNKSILVFHAGTDRKDDTIITSGGRVLNIVSLGRNLVATRNHAYQAITQIQFENMHYRKDIGLA